MFSSEVEMKMLSSMKWSFQRNRKNCDSSGIVLKYEFSMKTAFISHVEKWQNMAYTDPEERGSEMLTKKEIRRETYLTKSLQEQFLKQVEKLPKGVLYLKKGHGAYRPYQKVDGREHYLNRKKASVIQGLKDKKRLRQAIEQLAVNLTLLEQLENNYTAIPDLMPDNMSASPQPKGPILKTAPLMSREKLIEITVQWKTQHNGNTHYRPEERIHRTSDGICVRSKSELVIYEYLKSHGIPFVYELPVQLDDHWRYPDFTLIRESDGRVFLWEHLGCMNDPVYCQANIRKINEYMADNYFPFRDVLFSYDYEDGSLDLLELDRMLQGLGFID